MTRQGAAPVVITADGQERAGGVLEHLATLDGVEVRVERLALGDYLLGGGVAVERKTAADFAASIADRRLFRQVEALQEAFARPILLLEGDPLALEATRLHPNAIRGALGFIAAVRGVPVVPATGPAESAALLATMARQVQVGYATPEGRAKPRAATVAARQEAVAGALPGIGPRLGRRLLAHFGSLRTLAAADARALGAVAGIGPRRADALAELLAATYLPDEAGERQPSDRGAIPS